MSIKYLSFCITTLILTTKMEMQDLWDVMAVSVFPHHFKGMCGLHLQGLKGSRQYVPHNFGNYSLYNTMSHHTIK